MKRTIHAVSHTHWDREWYFTTLDSQVLAIKSFTEIIETLEKNDRFDFHLDAQSSIIMDYLSLRPEMTDRVKKLVKTKRLFVGPWFTQPDMFNIHTESFFRNLRIGIHYAQELGHSMNILYIPDAFGSHAQVPQMAKAFHIDNILIRRGYHPEQMGSIELAWEALNGDTVKTVVMPFGYILGNPERGARYRNFSAHQFEIETFPLMEKMKEYSTNHTLLAPLGSDQVVGDFDFDLLVDEINKYSEDTYIVSTYEQFMSEIQEEDLTHYQGEFRSPKLSRVHKTIGSSRYDIKQLNYQAEQYLIHTVEPMIALTQANGFYVPVPMLEKAWKLLLESHAHDSMGGCNSDETNRDVIHRCRQALQIGESLYNLCAKLLLNNWEKREELMILIHNGTSNNSISSRNETIISHTEYFEIVDENNDSVSYTLLSQEKKQKPRHVLLTPAGEVETEVDEYYYVNRVHLHNVDIAPLSVSVLRVIPAAKGPQNQITDSTNISNSFYTLTYEKNNLTVHNKLDNTTISEILTLTDCANDGDLYDFSPLPIQKIIEEKNFEYLETLKYPTYDVMYLQTTMTVPYKINETRTARTSHMVEIHCKIAVSLEGSMIRFELEIDNQALEHQMGLQLKSGFEIQEVSADLPFGYITRKNQKIEKWDGYTEKPVDVEQFHNSLITKQGDRQFSLFAKGLKEYAYEHDYIDITLFRGAGYIGKNDLVHRPGRASGFVIPAPEGNIIGKHCFEIGVSYQPMTRYAAQQLAQEYAVDTPIYQLQENEPLIGRIDNFDMYVPEQPITITTLIDAIPEGLVLSAVDVLFDKTILRMFNPMEKAVEIPHKFQKHVVNALGEPLVKTKVKGNDHINILLQK